MKNPPDFTRKDVRVTEAHSGDFNRRKFLTRTALVGAGLSVGSALWAAPATSQPAELEKERNTMKTRNLGNLKVSELGTGAMSISGNYGPPADKAQGIEVIRSAYERGARFFDTAEVYGPYTNEELVGEPRLALNRTVVLRFRLYLESLGLAAGTVNQRLAAVRRLAYEAADSGLLSPELAAGILRVKGAKQLGARTGNWLTQDQARLLLEKANGDDLRSARDLAMISVLVGCGLRRAELSALTVEDLQIRQGHWAIVDLVGKGGHVRTVPMPAWVKDAVDQWRESAKVTECRIFRAVSRHGTPWGKGISENVIWYVVRRGAERMQLDHLAPRDLRRTCAKLCHVNGGELEQIQFLLGHVSVLTTERYLGCKQNLEEPVNDRFGCLFARTSVELR